MTKKGLSRMVLDVLRAGGQIRIPDGDLDVETVSDVFEVFRDTVRGELVIRLATKS